MMASDEEQLVENYAEKIPYSIFGLLFLYVADAMFLWAGVGDLEYHPIHGL